MFYPVVVATQTAPPIRAFTVDKVVRVTGLTRRQLQYWDEQGFIAPSLAHGHGRGHPRLYDFRDLVSLRVAADLRDQWGISLQQIRKVVVHLRTLDYERPLSQLQVFARQGELYFREAGSVRSARQPSQTLTTFTIPFEPLIHLLEAAVAELDARKRGLIETRRGALGSKPLIAGTRIPVATVQRMAAAGLTQRRIREHYPDLTTADIRAAMGAGGGSSKPGKRAS